MIYEYYRDGRLVERQEPLDQDGDAGETRIQLAILEREQRDERDGWYRDGEWARLQAAAAAVQDSTVPEVLDEVGDDPAKARAALEAEQASGKPRKTLTTKLAQRAEEE